ncbi:hypothetical protein [Streptomyces halobius]|uniref:Uncharacterized protein n=1 Tax=Streptomyces halobius TaxID=2879846 RepID=A0ABY4MJN1_9ACTN|nr:hypothetical protein [Streptomyces halobius]UQA97552.1 hypothetical protein K9S39_41935 [Streptomyces halobius]
MPVPKGRYAVDADNDGGGRRSVDVTVDPASPHKIKARTSGGRATVESTD